MKVVKVLPNTPIYFSHYEEPLLYHYTTVDKWEIYMDVRRHTPSKVIIFDRLWELKAALRALNYYI